MPGFPRFTLTAVALSALATATAIAGDHRYDVSDPVYRAECASCHLPYPPALLPDRSWRALTANLRSHFGSDASLDRAALDAVDRFLAANAGQGAAPAGPEPRISTTPWFQRKHRKVPAARWTGPAVKSAANCAACHSRADAGDYSERTLHVPR